MINNIVASTETLPSAPYSLSRSDSEGVEWPLFKDILVAAKHSYMHSCIPDIEGCADLRAPRGCRWQSVTIHIFLTMKFASALLLLVVGVAEGFTVVPKAKVSTPDAWRPPMNMVAGGAERAAGGEYYEGE